MKNFLRVLFAGALLSTSVFAGDNDTNNKQAEEKATAKATMACDCCQRGNGGKQSAKPAASATSGPFSEAWQKAKWGRVLTRPEAPAKTDVAAAAAPASENCCE